MSHWEFSPSWSLPFHGVRHLQGIKKQWQITVEDNTVYALFLVPPTAFTPVFEKHCSSQFDAQAEGERFAAERGLIA